MNESMMTRRLNALLCGALLLGSAACSGDDKQTQDMASNPYNNVSLDMDTNPDADPDMDAGPDISVPSASLRFEEIELGEEITAMTELRFIPGTSSFFITRKTGEVVVFTLEGAEARKIGSFNVPDVFSDSDCGLISAAVDPDYATNNYVYFGYCTALGKNTISRHTLDLEALDNVGPSGQVIIKAETDEAEKAWHNVGSMGFDEEGYMWAIFGENASKDLAQDLSNPLGSVIRIKPNKTEGEGGYEPAPDNPFIGQEGKSQSLYAFGLRSPWRGHVDSKGRFWVGDVGAADFEEVNVVTSAGQNFGWPDSEGPCTQDCEGQTDPVISWDRSLEHPFVFDDEETMPTDRRVVWIGAEHRPPAEDDPYEGRLANKVLYGDFCTGWVRTAMLGDDDTLRYDAGVGHLDGVVSWDQGDDHYLYTITYGNCFTFPYKPGKLYRAVLEP